MIYKYLAEQDIDVWLTPGFPMPATTHGNVWVLLKINVEIHETYAPEKFKKKEKDEYLSEQLNDVSKSPKSQKEKNQVSLMRMTMKLNARS